MPDLLLTTPTALWGLLALIPIVILYLLKPKPKHIKFPSVMFFVHTEKTRRLKSFLKRLIRDPLLLLQLLVISLLVAAAAEPYFFIPTEQNPIQDAVIVLDSSASMQSTDVAPTRFERAKAIASDLIDKMSDGSTVSVVLAESVPIMLFKGLGKKEAATALKDAFVSDTPTNLGDGMSFGKDLYGGDDPNKQMYVLSDYAASSGPDLKLTKRMLATDNITATLIKVSGDGGNVGMIDAKSKRFLTDRNKFYLTYTVKNYFGQDRDVSCDIILDGLSLTTQKATIPAGTEKLFVYENNASDDEHTIKVALEGTDALPADDAAYLYLPLVRKYKVLLITNGKEKESSDQYLIYALQSSKDITLEYAIPPVIPRFDQGYDVVIMGEVKKDLLLPGTFRDLKLYVQNGGHLIFLGSSELSDIRNDDFDSLIPVHPESLATPPKAESVTVLSDNEIFSDVVSKGSGTWPSLDVNRYIKTSQVNGSEVLAEIAGSPAVAYWGYDRGRVFYVGINSNPAWTNFYYSSSFPVFWIQLIDYITREESTLGVDNFRTGDYLPASGNATITTPSGRTLAAANLVLDEQGFYDLERSDRTEKISASLISDMESNIKSQSLAESFADKDFTVEKKVVDVRQDLFRYLLYAAVVLFLAEVFLYKRRGAI